MIEDSKDWSYTNEVGHQAAALLNAQTTIRFIDTKAGAVIAFATTLFGIIGLVGSWLLEIISDEQSRFSFNFPFNGLQWTSLIAFLVFVTFLIFAARTLYFSFKCILPQNVGSTPPTILFPYWDAKGREEMGPIFEKFETDFSLTLAKKEYSNQIGQLGEIVKGKIDATNIAVKELARMTVSAGFFVCTSLIVFAAQKGLFG